MTMLESPASLAPATIASRATTFVTPQADPGPVRTPTTPRETAVEIADLHLFYGKNRALHGINLAIPEKQVTAFIGPSGCGKSTLLRCLNRMNDLVDSCRIEGSVKIHGREIYTPRLDVIGLRKRIGMVFQKPNPFPKSIFENVIYSLRIDGIRKRGMLAETVERSLIAAGLWEEVKDRLHGSALALSGGQQQRLCIARAIAAEPEVLLMDEPCSALDPIATNKIEQLMESLRQQVTIVIVTHNMHQAARVADVTAFFYMGKLVEAGATQNTSARETSSFSRSTSSRGAKRNFDSSSMQS